MAAIHDIPALDRAGRAELRLWLLLAVGALALAGLLALALALARAPGSQAWLSWGAEFFHKGLVTHVVFSFQVWLLAMLGALTVLAAPRGAHRMGLVGATVSALGCALLLAATLGGLGDASLNNYVPVLSHPLYYAGLALIGGGVALASARLLARRPESAVDWAIQAAAVALLAALVCFALAAWKIPAGTLTDHFNERLFWGGGHVLQFVNTLLLLAGWHVLAGRAFGAAPLPPVLTRTVFAALAVFALASPLVYARLDVLGLAHRQAFTHLLWVGLPLPPLVMGAGLAWQIMQGPRDWRSPAFLALVLSLAVFGLGGAAGFGLGVADTRTPSHYHAVIGGVNLALMGLIHAVLLPLLRRDAPPNRWVLAQFYLYGLGQLLHAAGFYLAGLAGVARKTAGIEQGLDSAVKLAAMGAVGAGGVIAVLGGVIFVIQVLRQLLAREVNHD